jgi:hypothetical protein
MAEQEQKGERSNLATIAGAACCTFCGRPDGRPIHGMTEISVCARCLHTACKEMLTELNNLGHL